MSQFAELLAQLSDAQQEQDTLAKSIPAADGKDDTAIQAAAAEGDPDADNENPEDGEVEPDGDEGKGAPMAKSVAAVIDGEEVEAIDATEIIKSLQDRLGATEEVLAKGLQSALTLVKTQGDMIKSMNARIEQLAGQGKGRKTVLTISEKPAAGGATLAKAEPQGLTPSDFMAKANAAFAAGKLTGQELTVADVSLRSGMPVPENIIAKALA